MKNILNKMIELIVGDNGKWEKFRDIYKSAAEEAAAEGEVR